MRVAYDWPSAKGYRFNAVFKFFDQRCESMENAKIGSVPLMRVMVAGCLILSGLFGCSGGGLPEGATGTVSGTVTFNDKPAPEGATVVFMHKENGLVATGTISADGAYSLQMREAGDILVGTYNVSVTPPTSENEMTPEQAMEASMAGTMEPAKEWKEIPEKYRASETSGETFEVKEGANTYDLKMKG
jgi:hypothetical protein